MAGFTDANDQQMQEKEESNAEQVELVQLQFFDEQRFESLWHSDELAAGIGGAPTADANLTTRPGSFLHPEEITARPQESCDRVERKAHKSNCFGSATGEHDHLNHGGNQRAKPKG